MEKKMYEKLEVIDFESRGNVIRFYLGKNGEQFGDDWDDAPYEDNAGTVYDEFIEGAVDIAFDLSMNVFVPSGSYYSAGYRKDYMVKRRYPCVSIVERSWECWDYEDAAKSSGSWNIYFGDVLKRSTIEKYHGPVLAEYGKKEAQEIRSISHD